MLIELYICEKPSTFGTPARESEVSRKLTLFQRK